jgi:hypothetical protein
MSSKYEELLADLDLMAKASPPASNPAAGGDQGGDAIDDDEDQDQDGDGDGQDQDQDGDGQDQDQDGDGEMFGKSMTMLDEDGNQIEAFDGTAMVKSLVARLDANESNMTAALTKAIEVMGNQDKMIKSLADQVKTLGSAGRGRRTVVSMHDSASMAKALPVADKLPTGLDMMAKALTAQKEGRLTSVDVAVAEGYLQKGMPIPENIVRRIG